ncbi:MAG: adenylyl-sulfate kinase, partial [Polyangiaceae bacterium]
PGYNDAARDAFYETLARLAALIARQGLVVLVPATAHRRRYRDRARELAPRMVEVYVATDVTTCAERDAKGLYGRSAAGELTTDVPGAGTGYDMPDDPDVVADGGWDDDAIARIVTLVADP